METSNCEGTSGGLRREKHNFPGIPPMKFLQQTKFSSSKLRPILPKPHMSNDKVSIQFPCCACKQMLSSVNELNEHDKKHKYGKMFLYLCNSIKNNIKKTDDKNDDSLCVVCGETFKSVNQDKHNEMHGRHYIECDFCEIICYDEQTLKKHLVIHEEKKQAVNTLKERDKQVECHLEEKQQTKSQLYQCTACRRKFLTQNDLVKHKRICIKIKYKCPKCKKVFSKQFLGNHICRS